jgi:hypothetical protein
MQERFGVTMKERPLGVTELAVLALVNGIISLVAGLSLLGVGGLVIWGGSPSNGNVLVLGALTFAMAPVSLALGYGFWSVKQWAWPSALMVYATSIGLALFGILLAELNPFSVLVTVAVSAGVMWYLFQPQVRSVFGR